MLCPMNSVRRRFPGDLGRIVSLDEYAALGLLAVGITPDVVFTSWGSEIGQDILASAGTEVVTVAAARCTPDRAGPRPGSRTGHLHVDGRSELLRLPRIDRPPQCRSRPSPLRGVGILPSSDALLIVSRLPTS